MCVCVCVCVCRKPDCLHIPEIAVFCIATNSFATNHYSLRSKLSRSSRHCIHSQCCLLFLARLCVFRKYWSLSCVTWRTFHSGTRPQIIQSFWFFFKKTIMSGFAIGHPGQRRVLQLVEIYYDARCYKRQIQSSMLKTWRSNFLLITSLSDDAHLTLRWLMSYIYEAPILDVSRSHTTTQHSR